MIEEEEEEVDQVGGSRGRCMEHVSNIEMIPHLATLPQMVENEHTLTSARVIYNRPSAT